MYKSFSAYRNLIIFLILLSTMTCLFAVATSQINYRLLKEVPVLCYHQVRNYTAKDGAYTKSITVTPETFARHMKILADSGYTTILPDDLYAFYNNGINLPSKPVMISFDDNTVSQYENALPVLNKYGFKAAFFIMTVSIGRPGYMSREQMKQLYTEGHSLGIHTWDHHKVTQYSADDWKIQLDEPIKTIEGIIGETAPYFAYPYGVWNKEAIPELRKRGIKLAFILHTNRDENNPLFTVRRLMVGGSWSAHYLHSQMKSTFPE
jgi:peptidoglycan/xylan/chitin deacetylase (PgdA/CDA1 family)